MNKTKIVLMTTLLGSVLGLAACQVTPSEQGMNHDRHRHEMQRQPPTPEQRTELQAKREQRLDQRAKIREEHEARRAKIATACQGKRIGDRVNIQWNNRTIEGTCEVRFTPDQANFKRQA